MPGVPGKLVWAVAHKVVGATARPNLMQCLFVDVIHAQQGQRLQLMVAHTLAHVGVFCIPRRNCFSVAK